MALRAPSRDNAPHMDVLLALVHGACFLGIGIALPLPHALPRRLAGALLLFAACTTVAAGLAAPEERTLVTVHTFAGYEGAMLEPGPVHFPTGTTRAPGWQWPLPFAGFAILWAVVLLRLGGAPLRRPLWLPLLFAWTATAAWLGMQALAAPAAVVQPFGLDRFLWPAGLALALALALGAPSFAPFLFASVLGIVAARLPAALCSKLASDRGLGTSLDVSQVVDIVNPLTRLQFQPRLRPGGGAQQLWLIWAEHVVFYPAFHFLSLFGVAFAVWLWRKQARTPAPPAPPAS